MQHKWSWETVSETASCMTGHIIRQWKRSSLGRPRLLIHIPDDRELRVSLLLSIASPWIVRTGSLPSI